MRISSICTSVCLVSLVTAQNLYASQPPKDCDGLLALSDVIDWVTTADPMFRAYGVAKVNNLGGPLCVSKALVNYLRHLGFNPSPDKVLGKVCRSSGMTLRDLGKHGLTDAEMKELLRDNVHWLSEDQGYDDGYTAQGSVAVTGDRQTAIERQDLLNANHSKFAVLLKLHRQKDDELDTLASTDGRWVVLRRVASGSHEESESLVAQIEDPESKTLRTGHLEPLSPSRLGHATWQFRAKNEVSIVSALLSASLGFDED